MSNTKNPIGVKQYKADLRKANIRIAELEEMLSRREADTSCEKPATVEVVRIAAPSDISSKLCGTNAQKIEAMSYVIGALQDRLKLAGLEWEV